MGVRRLPRLHGYERKCEGQHQVHRPTSSQMSYCIDCDSDQGDSDKW